MHRINSSFFYSYFCVPSSGKSGGLLLFWIKELPLHISFFSSIHIDYIIKDPNMAWCFTGFYGNPKSRDQVHSWSLLSRLSAINNLSWIIGGDFNETLLQKEKKRGSFKI